jgi:hypothetical protein
VLKEIQAAQNDRLSQTVDPAINADILLKKHSSQRSSVNEEEKRGKSHSFKSPGKSVQAVRASKIKRRTVDGKSEDETTDFTPIGRSKTFTGYPSKTHEDIVNPDLYKIDLDQIHTSISTLFVITLGFSDELIKNMISGLGELIVNSVEESSSPNVRGSGKTISSHLAAKQKKNLFSLRKMTEIALVNIHRVEHFWQIIVDQLMVISVCNNEDFRSIALEAFTTIIEEILVKREHNLEDVIDQPLTNEIEGLSKLQPDKDLNNSDPSNDSKIESAERDVEEKVTPFGRKFNKVIN